jgi:hypothetical protein
MHPSHGLLRLDLAHVANECTYISVPDIFCTGHYSRWELAMEWSFYRDAVLEIYGEWK